MNFHTYRLNLFYAVFFNFRGGATFPYKISSSATSKKHISINFLGRLVFEKMRSQTFVF